MSGKKYTKEECMQLLMQMQEQLSAQGINRYPQRSDFSDNEVTAIKSLLGPWPRALEAAGVKPPRSDEVLQRRCEKRIRAKRRRNMAVRKAKKAQQENEDSSVFNQ